MLSLLSALIVLVGMQALGGGRTSAVEETSTEVLEATHVDEGRNTRRPTLSLRVVDKETGEHLVLERQLKNEVLRSNGATPLWTLLEVKNYGPALVRNTALESGRTLTVALRKLARVQLDSAKQRSWARESQYVWAFPSDSKDLRVAQEREPAFPSMEQIREMQVDPRFDPEFDLVLEPSESGVHGPEYFRIAANSKLFAGDVVDVPRGQIDIYANQPVAARDVLATLQAGDRITGFERGTLPLTGKGLRIVVLPEFGVIGFTPTNWTGVMPRITAIRMADRQGRTIESHGRGFADEDGIFLLEVRKTGTYYARATGPDIRSRTTIQTTSKSRLRNRGVVCLGRLGN